MEPKQDTGMGMGQWASKTLGADVLAEVPPEPTQPLPEGAETVTIADLLMRNELPLAVRDWLEQVLGGGAVWAEEHSPPEWAADEGLWEKAKHAAEQLDSSDIYAFATWWYLDFMSGLMA